MHWSTDELLHYLEGGLGAGERAVLARHLHTCEECQGELEQLNIVREWIDLLVPDEVFQPATAAAAALVSTVDTFARRREGTRHALIEMQAAAAPGETGDFALAENQMAAIPITFLERSPWVEVRETATGQPSAIVVFRIDIPPHDLLPTTGSIEVEVVDVVEKASLVIASLEAAALDGLVGRGVRLEAPLPGADVAFVRDLQASLQAEGQRRRFPAKQAYAVVLRW
ncbi:MAG: anti-sigma factor [Dehalococcoidia bacterium]